MTTLRVMKVSYRRSPTCGDSSFGYMMVPMLSGRAADLLRALLSTFHRFTLFFLLVPFWDRVLLQLMCRFTYKGNGLFFFFFFLFCLLERGFGFWCAFKLPYA
jgi:hypothetical protein